MMRTSTECYQVLLHSDATALHSQVSSAQTKHLPKGSKYGIPTYIYHQLSTSKNQPHVGINIPSIYLMASKPSSPFWSKQKKHRELRLYPPEAPNESAQRNQPNKSAPESAAPPGNPEMSRRREPTPHGCRRGRRSPEAGSHHPIQAVICGWLI